jgi:GNAT superfamily N-acetyltransferase
MPETSKSETVEFIKSILPHASCYNLPNYGDGKYFGLYESSNLIGVIVLGKHSITDQCLSIYALLVDPKYRKQKIATQLLKKSIKYALKYGFIYLNMNESLDVSNSDNKSLLAFYSYSKFNMDNGYLFI